MNTGAIDQRTQILLKLSPATELSGIVRLLTPEQKQNAQFKSIATERFLSSLRVGEFDDADLTRTAFNLDQYFLHSKLVRDAAEQGLELKRSQKDQQEIVEKIENFINSIDSKLKI